MRRRRITLPGGLGLEVAEAGPPDGLPVPLLHGATDSWRSFEALLRLLPRHWHVVAPSQRGHGGSDKPAQGYRTRDFAADAARLTEALGLAPAVVVGLCCAQSAARGARQVTWNGYGPCAALGGSGAGGDGAGGLRRQPAGRGGAGLIGWASAASVRGPASALPFDWVGIRRHGGC